MRKTCLEQVYELAKRDERVVFIGSDIGTGTLEKFKKEFPERFFMEGVSESHLISMMAGLSMSGKIPYLNTIATFLTRRPFEQILLDGGLHHTNIRLIGSGGGVVYGPLGPTHLALEDVAILRTIPGMTIVAPCDAEEMKRLMPQTLGVTGPIYIRLAKGGDPVVSDPTKEFQIGKAIVMREGEDVLLISTGITTQIALDATRILGERGLSTTVVHAHTLKPMDKECLLPLLAKHKIVITVEEHTLLGGLGTIVAELMAEGGFMTGSRLIRLGFPDIFPHKYGSQKEIMDYYGISSEGILKSVESSLLNQV